MRPVALALLTALLVCEISRADGLPFIVKAVPESALGRAEVSLLRTIRADEFVLDATVVEINVAALRSTLITLAVDGQTHQLDGRCRMLPDGTVEWRSRPGSVVRLEPNGKLEGDFYLDVPPGGTQNFHLTGFGGRHAVLAHEERSIEARTQKDREFVRARRNTLEQANAKALADAIARGASAGSK